MTQRAVQRLPRLALLLFCAAYVLPGLFGRDPWRNADQTAFGYMLAIAEGRTGWLAPTIGGLPPENAVLPHWLGAASIWLLSPLIDAPMAARVPFGLLLAGVLALTWYTTFQLARTEAAQPVAFAFGGEATPVDYARAMADGALLALIASLGLLQLGHETTPELAQLFAAALVLWACAAAPFRGWRARIAMLAGLPLLAASGAPTMATLFGVAVAAITARSTYGAGRRFAPWAALATVLAGVLALVLGTWGWRVERRGQRRARAAIAATVALVPLAGVAAGAVDALALAAAPQQAPHLAAVGARDRRAAGVHRRRRLRSRADAGPAGLRRAGRLRAADAATRHQCRDRLVLGVLLQHRRAGDLGHLCGDGHRHAGPYRSQCRQAGTGVCDAVLLPSFALAVAGTVAWLVLVRWRTGRHQHALWKSLVLPAGGVALAWLMLMTLWLPLLDYARSNRPWVARLAPHVPAGTCVAAQDYPRSAVAALEQYGRWPVDAGSVVNPRCAVMLRQERRGQPAATVPPGWEVVARVRRPTDRDESTLVLRRSR